MTAFASPDWNWCTPVSVSGNSPVFNFFQPVSETFFTNEFREPVNCSIVSNQLVFEVAHLDVPGWLSIVNQWCSASPAVWVVMNNLFFSEDLVFSSQPFNDVYIQTVFHYETSSPWSFCIFTFFVNRVNYRQVIFQTSLIVVFTECRCCMNNTSTVFDCNVIVTCYKECFFVRFYEWHQLFIFNIFQIDTLHFFNYFVVFSSQVFVSQGFCNVEVVTFIIACCHLYFQIINLWVNCQCNVGSQCPWSCCPSQEVFVFSSNFLEFSCDSCNFNFFVSLSYFVGSQTCSATWAVWQDLVSLIDFVSFEKLFQDPPSCFDEVVVQSDVWVVQVDQVTHSLCHLSPHTFICEYGFTAFFIEFFDTVFFDILFAAHVQLFFYFDLYRQTVSIPSCFTLNFEALHCLVTAYRVFQCSSDNVVYTRSSVSCWRSFIEDERRIAFSCSYTSVQQVFFFPEICLFHLHFCNWSFG